ncbi:MAG TPA: iron ABC transporter permease [Firmicutes bacterium]|nr:iron ABC transporter permease [Bacillota bacterium]
MTGKTFFKRFLLLCGPVLCMAAALFLGRYPLPAGMVFRVFWSKISGVPGDFPDIYNTIVLDIRLSRILLGAMVGASLSVSGASYQGLFRNPLVSPAILGVSSGAGFGAALGILYFGHSYLVYVLAFVFAILAVFMSTIIGRIYSVTPTVTLVLGGVIVSSVFSSLISLVKYAADPYQQLPAIVFWLMGSLASARYQDIMLAAIPMAAGTCGLLLIRWQINILSMGEKEARTLGVNTTLLRAIVVSCATLATAGAVCVSGVIGWVGLVIPHIGRMLVGSDHKALLPASMSLGASYLILVDGLARTLTGAEIPLGILTALVGAPFFVYLLKTTKGGSW